MEKKGNPTGTVLVVLLMAFVFVSCGKPKNASEVTVTPAASSSNVDVNTSIILKPNGQVGNHEVGVQVYKLVGGNKVQEEIEGYSYVNDQFVFTLKNPLSEYTTYYIDYHAQSITGTQTITTGAASTETLEGAIVSSHAEVILPQGASGESTSLSTYWTEEKMQNAKEVPMALSQPVTGLKLQAFNQKSLQVTATPVFEEPLAPDFTVSKTLYEPLTAPLPSGTNWVEENYRLYPFAAVGKVYFTKAGGTNHVCSGSVIGKNIILTAGHCISDGAGTFHKNWIFVPQHGGTDLSSYGKWEAWYFSTLKSWHTHFDFGRDVAMVSVKKINGKSVSDIVGSLGFAYNLPRKIGDDIVALGYPAEVRYPSYPYNGNDMIGTMDEIRAFDNSLVPPANQIKSLLTKGASGGPWIHLFSEGQLGASNYVVGINSYFYVGIDEQMYSPYFDSTVKRLKDWTSAK